MADLVGPPNLQARGKRRVNPIASIRPKRGKKGVAAMKRPEIEPQTLRSGEFPQVRLQRKPRRHLEAGEPGAQREAKKAGQRSLVAEIDDMQRAARGHSGR